MRAQVQNSNMHNLLRPGLFTEQWTCMVGKSSDELAIPKLLFNCISGTTCIYISSGAFDYACRLLLLRNDKDVAAMDDCLSSPCDHLEQC